MAKGEWSIILQETNPSNSLYLYIHQLNYIDDDVDDDDDDYDGSKYSNLHSTI